MSKKTKIVSARTESEEESQDQARSLPEKWQQEIVDMGSATMKNSHGTIHCLTIVGQVEGHMVLSPTPRPPSTSMSSRSWSPSRRTRASGGCWSS